MLLSGDRVVFPDSPEPVRGWIDIAAQRIRSTGTGAPPRPSDHHLTGIVVPGYVDVHAHGGGGASFVTEDPDDVRRVLAAHRSRGTTTMVGSLVTGTIENLTRQVAMLAGLVESGELAGIHLEGPWLSEEYRGAHPEELLRDPTISDIDTLLDAGRGGVRMVTIAPERPGAMEAISHLHAKGVVVAIGHTAADYETTQEAVAAGARGATHLFNAMPPLRHRAPGPVLALREDPRVFVEIIFDGVHVRPEFAAFVWLAHPERMVMVTDAMAAAAGPDGDYVLGELEVTVRNRLATVEGTTTIAGSTLTLDWAVRNAVAAGVPMMRAFTSATAIPADYLGLRDVGRLAPGGQANLLELDDELFVSRVMHKGQWVGTETSSGDDGEWATVVSMSSPSPSEPEDDAAV